MVTITRHIFINIFQTERFSAVKFSMGYDKNMSFFVIPKLPKVWKKVERYDWAPLIHLTLVLPVLTLIYRIPWILFLLEQEYSILPSTSLIFMRITCIWFAYVCVWKKSLEISLSNDIWLSLIHNYFTRFIFSALKSSKWGG